MLERHLHGARCAFAVRRRRRHVVGVCRDAVSCDLTVNLRATRLGVLQFLYHHNACAFAHYKTVAVTVEGPRSALRLIVVGAERFHRRESCKANLDDGRLRTAARKTSASPNLIIRQASPMA